MFKKFTEDQTAMNMKNRIGLAVGIVLVVFGGIIPFYKMLWDGLAEFMKGLTWAERITFIVGSIFIGCLRYLTLRRVRKASQQRGKDG